MPNNYAGGCVCGAIRYAVRNLRPIWYCHCRQCRQMTGHFMAAAQVSLEDIEIQGEPKWYHVTSKSRYGFCPDCGSQLFWRNEDKPYMSVTAGSLDSSKGLTVQGHIYTSEKAEYVRIPADELKFLTYWSQPSE